MAIEWIGLLGGLALLIVLTMRGVDLLIAAPVCALLVALSFGLPLFPQTAAAGAASFTSGYMGGFTPNPTYEEVCSGRTGQTETTMVAFGCLFEAGLVRAKIILRRPRCSVNPLKLRIVLAAAPVGGRQARE
jgi:hypothetical protein